jgi:hypothetical protein
VDGIVKARTDPCVPSNDSTLTEWLRMDPLVVYATVADISRPCEATVSDAGVLPPAGRYEGTALGGDGVRRETSLIVRSTTTIDLEHAPGRGDVRIEFEKVLRRYQRPVG